jgi:hypothetical protein
MNKDILIEKVKAGKYSQEQLLNWIGCLPNTTLKIKPIEWKSGDVLMHSFFSHPYILLKKTKEGWLCGLLTSNEGCPEVLEQCQSRFFPSSYITKTLFITTEVHGSLMGVYQNDKHLREVLKKLKQLLN